jgi:hypothetical protein
MTHYQPVLESDRHAIPGSYDGNQRFLVHIEWSPTRSWAVATGALIFLGIASLTRDSEFLYWQF